MLLSAPDPVSGGLLGSPRRRRSASTSWPCRRSENIKVRSSPSCLYFLSSGVVRDILNLQGPYRITRDAILALRTMVEDYLVTTLEGANLACMHRNRCTLAPQDICLYRRIKGEDEQIGETLESQEARRRDWAKYKEGRLTLVEATVLDKEQRRKLRAMLIKRRQRALQLLKN